MSRDAVAEDTINEGVSMPDFTVTRQIAAPVEKVWEVLDDFGDIAEWNAGVKTSALTSFGPVRAGTTRQCTFSPVGAVEERIDAYEVNQRLTVDIFETSQLPISGAVADFQLAGHDGGTALTIDYRYEPNRLGRMAKGFTDKQMRKGISGLADDLKRESERLNGG